VRSLLCVMVISVVKVVFHLMSHDSPVGIATTLRTAIRRTVVRFPAETRSLLVPEEPRQVVGFHPTIRSVDVGGSFFVGKAGREGKLLFFILCKG